MVESLQFTLRVWDRQGGSVRRADFIDRLSILPGDSVEADGPHVRMLVTTRQDFVHIDTTEDAGAQTEAFVAALHSGLLKAGEWLARQPVDVFEKLRAAGRVTDVIVSGWITQDQFHLDLPPEFLRECGRLGLTLSVCTND